MDRTSRYALEDQAHGWCPSPFRRLWAARELAEMGRRTSAARATAAVMHDPWAEPHHRREAAQQLTELGYRVDTVTLLAGILRDRHTRWAHRWQAAQELHREGTRGRAALRALATQQGTPAAAKAVAAAAYLCSLRPADLTRRRPDLPKAISSPRES